MTRPTSRPQSALALLLIAGAPALATPPDVRVVNASAPSGGDGQSWATAYNTLQSALDDAAASSGAVTQIWIAGGSYSPTRRTDAADPGSVTFKLQSNLAVCGGFTGTESTLDQRPASGPVTTLTGATLATRPYHVVTASGVDSTATLDRVTITGSAPGFGPGQDRGGGLLISSASPTIADTVITANLAFTGAGIAINGGSPMFLRCTISANETVEGVSQGGAGALITAGSPTFDSCTFQNNEANGPVSGGAIRSTSAGVTTVKRSRFVGNLAEVGGAISGANLTLINCLVRNNPGGIAGTSNITIANCTIINNPPVKSTSWCGININNSGTVANSIVWGNGNPFEPGLNPQVWGNLTITNSCVEPNSAGPAISGAGLIRTNPLLVDADGRIGQYSPCIDAGANGETQHTSDGDLDGATRVRDDSGLPDYGTGGFPFVDMGAFEFQGTTCYANCDLSTDVPALNIADYNCFLNRFNSGDPLANCDNSTMTPRLTVLDFTCFMNRFAAGCP